MKAIGFLTLCMRLAPPACCYHTAGQWPKASEVYVLELAEGNVYVGKTTNHTRRIGQHQSGCGAAFTRRFPPTGTLLPRLGDVRGSGDAAERDETLRYMFLRGPRNVRGWKYTQVTLSQAQEAEIEGNIRELFDFCRNCGYPGHFRSECRARFDRLGARTQGSDAAPYKAPRPIEREP